MSDDSSLFLLASGPVGATALYWLLYRYYRNTDKSHAFERETAINAQPVTGSERKIGTVTETQVLKLPPPLTVPWGVLVHAPLATV